MPKPRNPESPPAKVFDIGTGLAADNHENAAGKALDWLRDRHRKGWRQAFDDWIRRVGPPGAVLGERLDADALQGLTINASEWLLARGEIFAKGEMRRINAHVLGPDGPWFSPAQRQWIAQMAERPLALYRVTQVRVGKGMTLVDALDHQAAPVRVQEISGSRDAKVGMLLGARLMRVGDHWEMSGAGYNYDPLREAAVLAAVIAARDNAPAGDPVDLVGIEIARRWLAQWFEPPQRPKIVDAGTGEAMLLVNEHYQVLDAAALAAAMAKQPDVEGSAAEGWRRMASAGNKPNSNRIVAAVHPGNAADRIVVFTRTLGLADSTRLWFDALAGTAVRHLARELVDPLSGADHDEHSAATSAAGNDLSPEATTALFEQVMRQHYADWADVPVPLLGDLTPRQAITTPGGLERVKGLLRYYEDSEARMAKADGRGEVSYQFLWDSLGITR